MSRTSSIAERILAAAYTGKEALFFEDETTNTGDLYEFTPDGLQDYLSVNFDADLSLKVDKVNSFINVKDYGAVGNGVSNDISAVQSAITAALALGGKTIFFPAGTYWFPATIPSESLDPGIGDLIFKGEGIGASILHYDEGTGSSVNDATAHAMFKNITNTSKGFIRFEDLEFRGTMAASPGRRGGCPMWLDYYKSVVIRDCRFYDIANVATDIHFGFHFEVTGCHFENISADAIRARDTPNCIVTNNYIYRIGDDSIALHTSDSAVLSREGLIVSNNTIVNGGAIKLLGGRSVTVTGNQIKFGNLAGIVVGISAGDAVEGNLPIRDINVSGNIIENLLIISSGVASGGTGSGIIIDGIAPRGSTGTNNTTPGKWDITAGAFVYPWDYDDVETDDADNPVPPQKGVVVSGNIIRRTAPAVALFSDYGFGTRLWQGVAYDPEITDVKLKHAHGINFISGGLHDAVISGNIIEHWFNGINFGAATSDFDYVNVIVKNNIIFDCNQRGVLINSASFSADITFEGNTFDCDPYRSYTTSNTNGTYDSDGVPSGIDSGNIDGLKIIGNKFKNCCRGIASNIYDSLTIRDNLYVCGPVATALGFTNTNKGIGTLQRADGKVIYEIIDADPMSATYGAVSNIQLISATSIPTSGWYAAGAFVHNGAPTIDGNNMIILGWKRLTTGTGHVSGTDWAIVRTSTVSPAT